MPSMSRNNLMAAAASSMIALDRDEPLQATWRSEALHQPFAFSQRQM
jgi:hypothetical protein